MALKLLLNLRAGERQRVEEKEREGIKWSEATMGAGVCSMSRGTALICIRPILHG